MGYKEILQKKQAEAANTNFDGIRDLPQTETIAEDSNEFKFFGVENVRGYPTCLDLRLADGNFRALPYSFIMDIDFNISDGIEITTSTKKIIIEGRNLRLLYNHLIAFRLKYIQANIGNDLCEDKDLFVKEIKIEEL